jgi:type IV secretory pathway VirJ component
MRNSAFVHKEMLKTFFDGFLKKLSQITILIFLSTSLVNGQKKDVPLIVSNNDTSGMMVFHITGDGGWRGYDVKLGEQFKANHIPYVALNAIKYFWSSKTPEQLANDLVPVISEYSAKWGKSKIILTGFSFGAETLPFLYTRLPGSVKQKIQLVVLITPAGTSDFTIHLTDMLGVDHVYDYNVVKEVEKIKDVPVLALFGDRESSTFPAKHKQDNVKIEFVNGSHHFTDGKAVMDIILKNIR